MEIPKLHQSGIVATLPDAKGELQVQIGVMKVNVQLSDLRIDQRRVERERTGGTKQMIQNKSRSINSEIDLHGLTVEEATYALDKYLDDAFLANLHYVRIIHGRGTGALKAGLMPYLKKHRLVAGIKSADYNEGGWGVTVVELK